MLSEFPDFTNQKTLLGEEAEKRGDKVIFGVKFHPELMPIKAAYCSVTKAIRISNTVGRSKGFKKRVEEAQATEGLTIEQKKVLPLLQGILVDGDSLKEIAHLKTQKH